MLLTKMPAELFNHLDNIFPALSKTLKDPDDEVVRLDLEVDFFLIFLSLSQSLSPSHSSSLPHSQLPILSNNPPTSAIITATTTRSHTTTL
jgi:hypothetical protein